MFKNTASQKLRVFAFADAGHASLDPGEPVTGDAANISAQTALDNAALGASDDVAPTEVDATNAPGYYEFDPTQSETNGDVLEWYAKSSTAGVQVITVGGAIQMLLPPNLPDLGIETDGDVHADVKQWNATTVTGDGDWSELQTDIDAILIDTDTTIPALLTAIDDYIDTEIAQILSELATVDANVDAILLDTAEIGVAGVGLTNLGGMSTTMKAEVNAECDTANTDYGANTTTPPTAAAIADQVWEETLADHSGTSGSTAEALNAAGAAGDPWTTSLPGSYTGTQAGKMLSDILTDTATLGTMDGKLDTIDGNVDLILVDTDTTIPALLTAIDDYIDTEIATIISDIAALNDPTAAAIADAVWDELQSAHTTVGTFGVIASEIATIDTVVDGIQTDLDNGTDGLGAIKTIVDSNAIDLSAISNAQFTHSSNTSSILTIVGTIDTNLDSLIVTVAALNDLSTADLDTALTDIHLDHLFATDYDPASKPGTSTALLNELIESDGGVSRFTTNALEQAPSGGGGGGDVTVAPLTVSITSNTFTTSGGTILPISIGKNESKDFVFALVDGAGDPVDLSGKTTRLVVHDGATTEFTVDGTVGGVSNNQITVTIDSTDTSSVSVDDYEYKLWNVTDTDILASGDFRLKQSPIS